MFELPKKFTEIGNTAQKISFQHNFGFLPMKGSKQEEKGCLAGRSKVKIALPSPKHVTNCKEYFIMLDGDL